MITEQSLLESGFNKQIFFFQIGNGEDEDDIDIYIKGNLAITYHSKQWKKRPYDQISYVNGFGLDEAEVCTESEVNP